MKYAVIIEKGPTSFGAYVPDLPGCIAAAETCDEVERLIREAIEEHIALLRGSGDRRLSQRSKSLTSRCRRCDLPAAPFLLDHQQQILRLHVLARLHQQLLHRARRPAQ